MISINKNETIICRHILSYLDMRFPNVMVRSPQKIIWFISNEEIVLYIMITRKGEYQIREGYLINRDLICTLFGINIILYHKFFSNWIKIKLMEFDIKFPNEFFSL